MQLIAKNRSTARLQDDNWQPCVNRGSESTHDLAQIVFGSLKHSEVVKWPPATQRTPGTSHLESCRLEHIQSGPARFWLKKFAIPGMSEPILAHSSTRPNTYAFNGRRFFS